MMIKCSVCHCVEDDCKNVKFNDCTSGSRGKSSKNNQCMQSMIIVVCIKKIVGGA
jgi:hypothetical protein